MTAITTRTEPCWIVTLADGSPSGFEDSEPHYDNQGEAEKAATAITHADELPPIVKRLDGLCSSATTACGYRYDEDDEGIQHWPDSAEEFRKFLVFTMEYRSGERGDLLCPADRGCDECDALAADLETAEVRGQMPLIPEETR
ncbi:hypothetical protein AB0F72_09275 [Actinoplanes sp. NPDC023936]|uniref:hypothetical protein n=1 Tax=Actinoplanes sp. NPDC023936 TaxID=3154910 RepID=UPI00340C03C5